MKPTLLVAGALVLAACGTTSPTEPGAQAPANEPATEEAPAAEPAADEPAGEEPAEEFPAAEPPEDPAEWTPEFDERGELTTETSDDDAVAGQDDADEPSPTTTLVPATTTTLAPEPVELCAGAPTELAFPEGPRPEIAVLPAAADASPLPDLAVRQINCGPGWVNLKNFIPGDRPVLIWAWAPH